MTFYDEIQTYDWDQVQSSIYSKTDADVQQALLKSKLNLDDFMALISPAGANHVEQMAAKSMQLTQQRFGKTTQLYIPLYLSNACKNFCVYCGFNHDNKFKRKILTNNELRSNTTQLKTLGFDSILLVSGEDDYQCGVDYFAKSMDAIRDQFAQISLEVQPLKTDEYRQLKDHGLHAVYIYQETYNEARYGVYHPKGRKANYRYRLEGPDRIAEAGIHKVGLGVLLGLEDWRTDSFFTAAHLSYLEKKYWQTKYSLAFPRLRPHAGGFEPNSVVTERELVQLICAYRLLNQHVELSISTRESPYFRDNMLKLGVTTMSAGSKTNPGGYTTPEDSLEQFSVNDERSAAQVTEMITSKGYEVVWKDWDNYL